MMFQVKDGCFSYQREKYQRDLLQHINFTVEQGQIMTILGANGSGKTTLVKTAMGILKWTSGATFIDGKKLNEYSSREIWQQIAYVPQAKLSPFSYTVEEMVLLGRNAHLHLFEQPGRKDKGLAREVLSEIGIGHLIHSTCGEISGGELQMVLIARALCAQPKLLILDEPESNLDFKNQLIVLETVKRLSRDYNLSAIINTHFPEHAIRISDLTLLVSKKNKTHYFGETKFVVTEPNLREIFDVDVHIRELEIREGQNHTCVIPEACSDLRSK